MSDVTRILTAIQSGDAQAADELLPLVYNELRRLAAHQMAGERPGQTLQPTALVHEAWLRLVGNAEPHFEGRRHFLAAAASAMQRILIDNARRKRRLKRGADPERVSLDELALASPVPDEELLALDDALAQLSAFDARAAEVVKLCFFVGLTHQQVAHELGVSLSTVERLWAFARAWLFREINRARGP